MDEETLDTVAKVYELVVEAGVYRAESIKVAEAAKVIENSQRDINIAFMNELSMIFNKMGIDTRSVLEAAGTKWNFLKFAPGLVGGHCIGVDPYYLTYKAESLGYHSQIILSGRRINDDMGKYVAESLVKNLIKAEVPVRGAKVAILGFTFKENFNFPYASTSMTEFWRRWHISLSTWFKEYLYIPLGGNRRGRWRTALNRLIVFFCTGIWHGANWTFVVWGLCHGALTSLENLGVIPVKRLQESRVGQIMCRVYTLLSVMLLFVVFRAASLGEAARVIGAMFSGVQTAEGSYMLHYLLTPLFCVTLVAAILFSGSLIPRLRAKIGEPVSAVRVISAELLCLLLFALSVFSLARGGFNPFIYFQF